MLGGDERLVVAVSAKEPAESSIELITHGEGQCGGHAAGRTQASNASAATPNRAASAVTCRTLS